MAEYTYSFTEAAFRLIDIPGRWPIKVRYDRIDTLNTYGIFKSIVEDDGTLFIPAFGAQGLLSSETQGFLFPMEGYSLQDRSVCKVGSIETLFKTGMRENTLCTLKFKDNIFRLKKGIILSRDGIPYIVGGRRYHVDYPDNPINGEIIINSKCLLDINDPIVKFIVKKLVPFYKQENWQTTVQTHIVCKELEDMIIYPKMPVNPKEDAENAAKFLLERSDLWKNKIFNNVE